MTRHPATDRLLLAGAAAGLALGSVGVTACGDETGSTTRELTVFAASSLTEAFTEIGDAFHAAHPDIDVVFSFAGSGDLVAQLGEGAPADVLATADEANMAKAVEAGTVVGDPVLFATNTFGIIVGPGNPTAITGLADLADPSRLVVLCADSVPCGKGAATVLANAGVSVAPVSFEEKVKGVVTKVTSGEADAGIVFVTDIAAAGASADGVEIPADVNTTSRYPIAVTENAPNATAAAAFVEFVASDEGRAILESFGFGLP